MTLMKHIETIYETVWWKLAPKAVKLKFELLNRRIECREKDIRDLVETIGDLERGYRLLNAWYKAGTRKRGDPD